MIKSTLNLGKDLAGLQRMGPSELRAKYLECFGEATQTGNKQYLLKRVSWRLQMLAEGDLSERAKKRAAELANDANIRTTVPKSPPANPRGQQTKTGRLAGSSGAKLPLPGTVLTKQYKGRTIQVRVLAAGFDYEGEVFKSLTAVAEAVTGSHWNGLAFFGLKGK